LKRIKIILSVAVLLVTLSGCTNLKSQNNDNTTTEVITDNTTSNNDSQNIDNNTNKSEDKNDNETKIDINITAQKDSDNTDSTNNNNSSQNSANETSKDQKSFYGDWQIKKMAGYARITTGGDESLIGLKITLSKDLATLGNKFYDNPKYEITNKTKNEVANSFKTNLSDIGVNDNSIDKLDVLNKEDTDGMTFFIKDNNTLIYYLDGTYYETIRLS
jgi:hypothetical protein